MDPADARPAHPRVKVSYYVFDCLYMDGYDVTQVALRARKKLLRGERVGLGSLLLGFYSKGDFVYAGKVGTGFDDKLRHLRYMGLRRDKRPEDVHREAEEQDIA